MSGRRMTTEERARWRVRDDQCAVVLSSRLSEDSACLLPLPCPKHGPAPTPTLTDFLLARIAEDEAAVRAEPKAVDRPHITGMWLNSARHLVANPARVLAECEAKRRVITAASGWGDAELDARYCMDRIKRLLAVPYADHPEYREEWRP